MNAVAFSDLVDDGAAIEVIADVRLLPTGEGGKSRPISSTYRPNHNFGAPEDRHFYIGQLEIASGDEIVPGETRRVPIRFLSGPGLRQMLTLGREWRIQEGDRLVAVARVVEVIGAP